jgi:hypothetical protein
MQAHDRGAKYNFDSEGIIGHYSLSLVHTTLAYEIGVDPTSIPPFATICTGIRNFCMHIHLDIVSIGVGPVGVHVRCLHSGPWTCRGVEQVIVIRASVRISQLDYPSLVIYIVYCYCYNSSYFSPRRVVACQVLCCVL